MYPLPGGDMSSGAPPLGNFPGGFGSGSGSTMVNDGNFNMGGQNQWMNYPSMGGQGGPGGPAQGGPVYSTGGVGGQFSYNPATGSGSSGSQYPGSYQPPTSTYGGGYSGLVPQGVSPSSGPYGTPPGVVPPQGSPYPSPGQYPYNSNLTGGGGSVGTSTRLPGNYYGAPTVDPLFTQGYAGYLSSQLGTGISPYNLSAFLPSTGGMSGPGQVAAPLTPELQQLAQFFQTGQGGSPGMQSIEQMAQTGDPTDMTPAWQAMVKSETQNTNEQLNNLKEQFGGMGLSDSTTLGTAAGDFATQTALGQNAQLTAAEAQAQEAAAGRQMGASEFLTSGSQQMGQFLQGLDQQSISNLMNEYFMTQPQNNPLLSLESQFATAFPPIYGSKGFGAGLEESLASSLGQSLGSFGMSAGGGQPAAFAMGG
jgi:hypothetical protein